MLAGAVLYARLTTATQGLDLSEDVWLLPVYKLDMSEGEVSHLAIQFPLPLAVYGHFGYFDNVPHLTL